jgi:protein O-GlcNAc transferase
VSRNKKRSHKQVAKEKQRSNRANRAGRPRTEDLYARGVEYHRTGELDRAKTLYRQLLGQEAHHAGALHLLGFAELQSRNFVAAVESISAAVALEPDNAEFHNNLALSCLAAKRLDNARTHARLAAELGHADSSGYINVALEFLEQRDYAWSEAVLRLGATIQAPTAETHHYLGIVYAAQQRFAEAESCYRQALELAPEYLEALNNLGNALRDQNRIDEAIPYYQRALELSPNFAAALNNLGVAFVNHGKPEAGIACYERALRLQPDFAEALNNLGNAHRDLGHFEAALDYYQRALRIQAHSPEIESNLAVTLRRVGKLADAIGHFRRAVVLQPTNVKIHSHLASALVEQDKLPEAARCIRHIARLEPDQPLWQLQAAAVCPAIFSDREEMEQYVTSLFEQVRAVSQTEFPFDLTNFTNVACSAPFNLQFLSQCIRDMKQEYASLFARKLETAYRAHWVDCWRGPGSRPRIGFVVTEDHEGIFLKSLHGVLARLSVRDFELVIFCSHRGQPRVRATIARDDLQIVPLPTRFEQIARTIDLARCDVLYYWETGTDAFSYFLPFLRLAPIQMTSWGIQVTSGIPNIDYYLSNRLVEPDDAAQHYSERLVLSSTPLTYRQRTQLPQAVRERESFGLPVDWNWYVCAQQLGKFHIDFDEMLAEVLRRDERGIVVLTGDHHGQQVRKLQQRLQRNIPDVASRVHFVARLETGAYLSLLHHAQVLLDPPHFGGVNSTYDGLSLGKPIVVMPSRFHRGRYTLACYRKMEFMDCVAESASDFARIAVRLGTDPEYRHHVERTIAEAGSVLFEDYQAVLEHERVFHELLSGR